MEKKKNNLIPIVIILIVLVLGLGGFIVYDKVLNNKENNNELENNENFNNNYNYNIYSNLTNISCYYDKNSETYNHECEIYNTKSLYDKYNLPNNHVINKLIVANDEIIYLVLSNGYYEVDTKYHEYLYSIEKKNSYFIDDNYKCIAGIYLKDNIPNIVLYNNVYGKYEFKTINLNSDSIVVESVYPEVISFGNPVLVSKNNKTYIILTLESEVTDKLILTTDFKKIDIGLAYHPYELTDDGNIKIFVGSYQYKIYDDKGNIISEGKY